MVIFVNEWQERRSSSTLRQSAKIVGADNSICLVKVKLIVPNIENSSCRIDPKSYPKLMSLWFDVMKPLVLDRGNSFARDKSKPVYTIN
jgi:hypothetical protein